MKYLNYIVMILFDLLVDLILQLDWDLIKDK